MLVSAKKSVLLRYIKTQSPTSTSSLTCHQDRKLLWKLDVKLIPWLSFLYLISFLDRTNIGNAKIDGLQQDLRMTNSQYNLSLTIFFISYSVFEPLTNVLLKKLRPSIFLPIIMVLWGICMTCMGLVHNYGGLMTAVSGFHP
jgi:sugar phosphate permease